MRRNIVPMAAIGSLVFALAACSDGRVVTPDLTLPTDFVISNSLSSPANTSAIRGGASISVTEERIVYVSLSPHTIPNAVAVGIQNQTTAGPIQRLPLIHGGFDPVPIDANEGDVLRLTVIDPSGARSEKTARVPARRPPTIVRSDPERGRTDVALNVSVTVVFTEPVDPRSVNIKSVYLLKEGQAVPGTVVFADNSWTVKFVPQKPLDANSNYELVVTPDIRDLDGDALEGSYDAKFITGTVANSACPGYADPSNCPPVPTGGSGVITGVVSERTVDGIKPLADATVYAWVQLGSPNGGYSRGGTKADAAGRFTITLLPGATIMLLGVATGYDQPCAVVVSFNGISATANIELVSKAQPLPGVATKPPIIKGVVYEMTSTGRQPVAGAWVYIDEFDDLLSAWTTTDENGRYAVCGIPDFGWGQGVYAIKTGYQDTYQHVSVKGTDELQLDLELKH